MEGYKRKEERCPNLLDLIPKETKWVVKMEEETSHGGSEEKKLELRLGPPGGDELFRNSPSKQSLTFSEDHHVFSTTPWSSSAYQGTKASFLQLQPSSSQGLPAVMSKESSSHCFTKAAELIQSAEKKAFSPPASANTAGPNSPAQKRTAPASVVGWPPVRSFRKNIASSSNLKSTSGLQNAVPNKIANEKTIGNCQKGLFVKINMDGIPIGRKVDLNAFDSYEKLSSAVDELFRGLLSAQGDSAACGIQNKGEGEKMISGLLDGSGEYTLVYEDNEGDRMLVGDVPWHMFVSTVKRLRVLKSSEISTLCRGSKARKALT